MVLLGYAAARKLGKFLPGPDDVDMDDVRRAYAQAAASIQVDVVRTGGNRFRAHMAQMRALPKEIEVTVGYHGGQYLQDGRSIPAVAARNEFGVRDGKGPVIPERPSMRHANEEIRPHVGKHLESGRQGLGDAGATMAKARAFGIAAARGLVKSVDNFSIPPNAPITLEQKRGYEPLEDSRTMIDAIDYRVRKR